MDETRRVVREENPCEMHCDHRKAHLLARNRNRQSRPALLNFIFYEQLIVSRRQPNDARQYGKAKCFAPIAP